MSDKPHDQLCWVDQQISKTLTPSMLEHHQGTRLTIEYLNGFEIFNTRPYHNYETWSTGWRVSGEDITVEREDLDTAITEWIKLFRESVR